MSRDADFMKHLSHVIFQILFHVLILIHIWLDLLHA